MNNRTTISVKINNDWRLISNRLSGKVAGRLNAAALNTEANAKESMKPGTGRLYKVTKTKFHRASEAGNPPAVQFGGLKDSIRVIEYANAKKLQSMAGTNLKYAPFLEFGAPSINLKPRPFWNPAVDKARKTLLRQLRELSL